jgi:hypothetical protein
MSKARTGIVMAMTLTGAGLLLTWQQQQIDARLDMEQESIGDPSRKIARLQDENRRLGRMAAEVEGDRCDARFTLPHIGCVMRRTELGGAGVTSRVARERRGARIAARSWRPSTQGARPIQSAFVLTHETLA